MSVKVQHPAPDFSLQSHTEKTVTLTGLKGKWVVLFFYPLDFTFVCPTEVVEFSKRYNEFREKNTEVLGCSIDSIYVHKAWAESLGGLNYQLLSDMHKDVGRRYGVLIEDKGFHLRGTFVIDPEGITRWININDTGVGRSVDEVLRVVTALQTGKLTACDWKPGQKTLN
ncbi:MAG: peroxiredoxin [Oligoflexia bacterium]|nr:peroxiredoxin [Oligoflexia bacterium]